MWESQKGKWESWLPEGLKGFQIQVQSPKAPEDDVNEKGLERAGRPALLLQCRTDAVGCGFRDLQPHLLALAKGNGPSQLCKVMLVKEGGRTGQD